MVDKNMMILEHENYDGMWWSKIDLFHIHAGRTLIPGMLVYSVDGYCVGLVLSVTFELLLKNRIKIARILWAVRQ